MGQLLVAMGRYAEAAEALQRCEELAPGWPNCRHNPWLAQQLATGAYEPQVLSALHQATQANESAEGLVLLTELVGQNPACGFLRLRLGHRLAKERRPVEAQGEDARGLQCENDDETQTALLVGPLQVDAAHAGLSRPGRRVAVIGLYAEHLPTTLHRQRMLELMLVMDRGATEKRGERERRDRETAYKNDGGAKNSRSRCR